MGMNYPAASYGVSKAPIRNGPFAASCGELTRMRLKIEIGNFYTFMKKLLHDRNRQKQ
jgi:hypothetical protein